MITTHNQNQLCLLEQRMPIFRRINSFSAPQYGFYNLFNGNISDLSKLSLSFKTKKNCEVKKYSHVDIDADCFERALQ